MKIGTSTATSACVRSPCGPIMNFQNPPTIHPEENSQAQASSSGGATLSTVNSAKMKQIAVEIRPIVPHSCVRLVARGCDLGRQRSSSWPDDAPPLGSAFARHGQNLRI